MKMLKNVVGASLLWASVLTSHYLAYLIAFPIPVERAHELSHSGHGWLSDVTHYGIPLFAAILAIGLAASPATTNRRRSQHLSLGSAIAFAGVEILERVINSLLTAHPFALSPATLIIGTILAAAFGYLISALFQEVRVYILNSFQIIRLAAPSSPTRHLPRTWTAVPYHTQDFLSSSINYRGPPALLNSN